MIDDDSSEAAPATRGRLAVVVVNYGTADLLRRNLAPVQLQDVDAEVVVVDNLSTADERRAVTELAAAEGWHLVAMPDNRGFGVAVNAGVAAAQERGCVTFCLLNPDAVVTAGVLAELRNHSLREPMSLIGPAIDTSAGDPWFHGSRLYLRDGRLQGGARRPGGSGADVDWLTAACLVVHQELFDRIGGFSDEYFMYWEDVDLSYRATLAGGRTVLRSDLVIVHDEGGSQGPQHGRAKSALYYRYNCRNRLLFAARNLRRRELLGWILRTPAVSWEIVLRGGRRQLLRSPRPLVAAMSGSLAGLGAALVALVTGAAARDGR